MKLDDRARGAGFGDRPRNTRLSIVHLLAPAPYGGLETSVITLSTALASAGQAVAVALVLTPRDEQPHPVQQALAESGTEVESLVVGSRNYLRERALVGELLRRRSADILHTHGYRPDVVDAPVARRMGVPTVTTVHGYVGGGRKNRAYEWLQNRALRKFDAVVAVSEPLANELADVGIPGSRIHMVRNAWQPRGPLEPRDEARLALGVRPDGHRVAWIGRMSAEKAPDLMVHAAASVAFADVAFSMVGEGPDRGPCEALARSLGIADRLSWHGRVADVGTLLAAFDAVVLTSRTEGTPMILLEAMAAGVPIVTMAVGGIPGILGPSEAHLCESGDVRQIAAAVDDVLARPEAARTRALAAKHRLERDLRPDRWAARHIEIYSRLVAAKGPRDNEPT